MFHFHAFLPGKEHSCQCTQGNMAHLQTHQVSEEDRSCQSAQTSAQVLAGHSPVSTMFPHFSIFAYLLKKINCRYDQISKVYQIKRLWLKVKIWLFCQYIFSVDVQLYVLYVFANSSNSCFMFEHFGFVSFLRNCFIFWIRRGRYLIIQFPKSLIPILYHESLSIKCRRD